MERNNSDTLPDYYLTGSHIHSAGLAAEVERLVILQRSVNLHSQRTHMERMIDIHMEGPHVTSQLYS